MSRAPLPQARSPFQRTGRFAQTINVAGDARRAALRIRSRQPLVALIAIGHQARLGPVKKRLMLFKSVADFVGSGFQPRVVIIGTGPAGISLALRLQEKKVPSLLIEAGGFEWSESSQSLYRGAIAGDSYPELELTRLRQFGGTSGHWSGWCRALDATDFEVRAHVPHSGWPIRKADLALYAEPAAQILQLKLAPGDRAVTSDFDELAYAFSPPLRFGTTYRTRLEQSSAIGLLLNTTVKELVPGNGRIESIKLADVDRTERTFRVEQICLCTGGIENSRLLLWSNARHSGGAVPNAASLGRYWMEHPVFTVGWAVISERAATQFKQGRLFGPSESAKKTHGIGGAHMWVEQAEMDFNRSKALIRQALCAAPALFERLAKMGDKELRCGVRVRMEWEQFPLPENRIELDRTSDPFGIPRARLHWQKSPSVRKTAVTALQLFGEALIQHDLGRLRMNNWLLDDGPYPDDDQRAGFHHMGGTRMSETPATGVVDRNCKVFGMANLYIGGSSVFTTGGHANPTYTIVQLALRLGDHLAATSVRA